MFNVITINITCCNHHRTHHSDVFRFLAALKAPVGVMSHPGHGRPLALRQRRRPRRRRRRVRGGTCRVVVLLGEFQDHDLANLQSIFLTYVQSWSKRWALGCVNPVPLAVGMGSHTTYPLLFLSSSQDVGLRNLIDNFCPNFMVFTALSWTQKILSQCV